MLRLDPLLGRQRLPQVCSIDQEGRPAIGAGEHAATFLFTPPALQGLQFLPAIAQGEQRTAHPQSKATRSPSPARSALVGKALEPG